MKIYWIPKNLSCILFDIDSTLYTNPTYAYEQVDVQVRHFASIRGISSSEARSLIFKYREEWAQNHNGEKISFGNALTAFGIPISESIQWRKKLIEPERYLHYDEKLVYTLNFLSVSYKIGAVTNNPVLPAQKTLDILGVSPFFQCIIGLDTCGISKPHHAPYEFAARTLGCKAEECISVGDRYDIDLAVPLTLGMGAILVNGVEDVYTLPRLMHTS